MSAIDLPEFEKETAELELLFTKTEEAQKRFLELGKEFDKKCEMYMLKHYGLAPNSNHHVFKLIKMVREKLTETK